MGTNSSKRGLRPIFRAAVVAADPALSAAPRPRAWRPSKPVHTNHHRELAGSWKRLVFPILHAVITHHGTRTAGASITASFHI